MCRGCGDSFKGLADTAIPNLGFLSKYEKRMSCFRNVRTCLLIQKPGCKGFSLSSWP